MLRAPFSERFTLFEKGCRLILEAKVRSSFQRKPLGAALALEALAKPDVGTVGYVLVSTRVAARAYTFEAKDGRCDSIPREVWDQLDSELEAEAPSARRKRPPRRRAG
jgi:hypothetical protein